MLIAVTAIYLVMSLITVAYYGLDKRRAIQNAWRIPERTLHTLEFLGGWPGALVAQSLFKHKRHKTRFLLVCYAISMLHVIGWAAVFWLWFRHGA